MCLPVTSGEPGEELHGPSGMTAEHLKLVLESVPDTATFHRAAQDLARAEIPS